MHLGGDKNLHGEDLLSITKWAAMQNKGHSTAAVWSLLGCLSKLGSKIGDDPSRWHMKNYGIHPEEMYSRDTGANGCLTKAVNAGLQGVQNQETRGERKLQPLIIKLTIWGLFHCSTPPSPTYYISQVKNLNMHTYWNDQPALIVESSSAGREEEEEEEEEGNYLHFSIKCEMRLLMFCQCKIYKWAHVAWVIICISKLVLTYIDI